MGRKHRITAVERAPVFCSKMFCKPVKDILNKGVTFVIGEGGAGFIKSSLYVEFIVPDKIANITDFLEPSTKERISFSVQVTVSGGSVDQIGLASPNIVAKDFAPGRGDPTNYPICVSFDDGLYINVMPKVADELVEKTIMFVALRGNVIFN